MMIFTSIYGMVDGFFISNYVGKTAFASVNLIMSYIMILGGVGAMLGVGGSAVVLTAIAVLLARPVSAIFVGYDATLLDMTARAFSICALPFLVMWIMPPPSSRP